MSNSREEFNKSLEYYGLKYEDIEPSLKLSSKFYLQTPFDTVLKVEVQNGNKIKFTPYYNKRPEEMLFLFKKDKLMALNTSEEIFINKKTGFLNFEKLEEFNLDYYIDIKDPEIAIVGLIPKINIDELPTMEDFYRDVAFLSEYKYKYLYVIKCYNEISIQKIKNMLKEYSKTVSKRITLYLTGLYEFTILSEVPVNALIVENVPCKIKHVNIDISCSRPDEIVEKRKTLFREIREESCESDIALQGYFTALYHKTDETVEHTGRVKKILILLADELELNDAQCENLLKMGKIHDLGKIAIESRIVNKSGKLKMDEFEIMKKHTILGYEMLYKMVGYEDARCACLYHHERWDGKGYPEFLTGTQIPYPVRMVSVADSIDAMRSIRTYKSSYDWKFIKEEIEKNAGKQFCPQVSKVCIDIWDKIVNIYDREDL